MITRVEISTWIESQPGSSVQKNIRVVGKRLVEFSALDSYPPLVNTRQIPTRLSCKLCVRVILYYPSVCLCICAPVCMCMPVCVCCFQVNVVLQGQPSVYIIVSSKTMKRECQQPPVLIVSKRNCFQYGESCWRFL